MRGSATTQPMISSSSGSNESLGVDPYDAAQQTRLIDAARLHRLEEAGERVEELQALHVAAEVVDQRLRDRWWRCAEHALGKPAAGRNT